MKKAAANANQNIWWTWICIFKWAKFFIHSIRGDIIMKKCENHHNHLKYDFLNPWFIIEMEKPRDDQATVHELWIFIKLYLWGDFDIGH